MRKSALLLFCTIVCAMTSIAQKNMSPGWVVLNNGDTLKGSINYRQWNINPQQVEFSNGRPATYSIKDLKAFGATNESTYQRFTVTRHPMPNRNIDDPIPNNEDSTVTSDEWLRVLVIASYGLAELTTKERSFYFLIHDNIAEELLYYQGLRNYTRDRYINTENYGKVIYYEITKYRDQLNSVADKLGKTNMPPPDNLRYVSTDLTAYILKITGSTSGTVNKVSRGSWGLVAEAGSCSYSFTGGTVYGGYQGTINNSIRPMIGINYTIVSARNLSRAGIMFDLGISMLNATGQSKPYSDVVHDIHLKNTYIEFAATPFYILNPLATAKFYLGAGARLVSPVSAGNYILQTNLTSHLETRIDGEPENRLIIGIHATAGVRIGNLNVHASYIPLNKVATGPSIGIASIGANCISAGITLSLGNNK